jgi:hypothetical protein
MDDRQRGLRLVLRYLAPAGFQTRAQIVWAKHHFALSRGHYHWQHKCCWYAVRDGKVALWQGNLSQTTANKARNLRLQ